MAASARWVVWVWVWWLAAAGSLRLSARMRLVGRVRGGGIERDNFFSSGGGYDEAQFYSEAYRKRPPAPREVVVAEEEVSSEAALPAFALPAVIGGCAATVFAMFFALTRKPSSNERSAEKMYADSVAALEAQLHRLSVDRQMLADEFAEARKGLESQIKTVTESAESSRNELADALERAQTDASKARAELAAVSQRLQAELQTTEQLRQDKARQQIELDNLRLVVQQQQQQRAQTPPPPPPPPPPPRRFDDYYLDDEDYDEPLAEDDDSPPPFVARQPPKKKTTTAATAPAKRKKKSTPTRQNPRPPPSEDDGDDLVKELRRQLQLARKKIAENGGDPEL
ncbi:hypothetical protein CTAYLR_005207 [Chrysophaeum taylorii]|uniref:Uncharacterized protein n=1 Tax=Chrysophaeum taylorii TaxID=2483200 RepID=A0AAD7UB09_9STRA|nr:hypothetical protein CTAYLR_005207 [Chrysophaeum taylorii]